MSRKTKRVLTDEQWRRIAPHLPQHPPSPKGGRPRRDDRECLEGLLRLLRTAARWQDIPLDLPSGSTCWRRLQEWAGEGVLQKIQAVLVGELAALGRVDLSELLADATFIRVDKGHDAAASRDEVEAEGLVAVIPHRRNRVRPSRNDGRRLRRYRRRWLLERTHAWLHCYRGLAVRWCRYAYLYVGLVYLSFIHLTLQRL